MIKRRYGWRPDKPDQRDFRYGIPTRFLEESRLPPVIDLRPHMPPVYDQGELGSCTANAGAAAVEYLRMKNGDAPVAPSRLFIYYGERVIEGTIGEDAGAEIRDCIKELNRTGVCAEATWPYDISAFTHRPSPAAYFEAAETKAERYERLDNTHLHAVKAALADGYPVIFGFSVYESFESQAVAASGKVPMPKVSEDMLGGHAVLAVGYIAAKRRFIVRNSWGEAWGDAGYCTMPYAYLTNANLADDFWILKGLSDI